MHLLFRSWDTSARSGDDDIDFMVPRYIRFVPELPKTPTERVQKVKLRDEGITADTFDREAAGITIAR